MIRRALALVSAPLLALSLLTAPARASVAIQELTTPAGHEAWLVEDRSIPMLALELIFPGGSALDSAATAGATSLMTSLMLEGAGGRDAQALAAEIEATAGSVEVNAGRDSVTVSIRALSENRDEVLALARLVLSEPDFTPEALERVRAQQLSALRRNEANPSRLGWARWQAAGFAGHPYGQPNDGTIESVTALTREDILAAHANAFNRTRLHIGASGDIGAEELATLLDTLLAPLPEAAAPLPAYHSYDAPGGLEVIPFPGPQSMVLFGHSGITRDDPDYMASFLMNEIFGGGRFGTRLMSELRESRGLTYGVGTGVASGLFGDSFRGQFATANARVGEAIAQLRANFEWLAAGGITEADLERVKTYLTGAYPLRFDGNDAIASILAGMQFEGYPADYVNTRNDLVRSITLEDVRRISARLARVEDLFIVVVGQPEGLEEGAAPAE